MKLAIPIRQPGRWLVPALFATVLALQVVDLHSTLTLGAKQHEANKVLALLACAVTLPGALLLVKAVDLAVVAGLYRVWRRTDGHDLEFSACLVVTVAVYAAVIANNYLGR